VPKSGHVTITKIENLHTDGHVEKFNDSKNAFVFDIRQKMTKLSQKKRFRTVASPGACERLAVLNNRLQYTLLVIIIIIIIVIKALITSTFSQQKLLYGH